jgi:hypothetical protein
MLAIPFQASHPFGGGHLGVEASCFGMEPGPECHRVEKINGAENGAENFSVS